MDHHRWQKAKDILDQAMDLPVPEQLAFLRTTCGEDAELLKEVQSLLEVDEAGFTFMEQSVSPLLQAKDHAELGEKVGRYLLQRELGQGGMGTVYLAERDEDRQRVALKILKRGMDTDAIVRRFQKERRILAQLSHPNISKLFDGGSTKEGLPYLVMEYVDGKPLLQYCDQQKLTIVARLHLFKKVCAAVHHAHRNLIIHRDLKPSNIMITVEGEPKLLDFGIAKIMPESGVDDTAHTATGLHLMTPEYASPEQMNGGMMSTSTDIYSLGVVLYQLLTGAKPYQYDRSRPQDLRRAICDSEPEKPSQALDRLNHDQATHSLEFVCDARRTEPVRLKRMFKGDLENILFKALRKDPERRYASAQEFAEDLDRYLGGYTIRARPETLWYTLRKFSGRHRLAVATSGIVVAGLIAFSITIHLKNRSIERQRVQTERVAEFMNDLFISADPMISTKADLTAGEILENAIKKIDHELHEEPEVRGELLRTLGWANQNLGNLDSAIAQLTESYQLLKGVYSEDHPKVARVAANLGIAFVNKGKVDEAEGYLTKANRIFSGKSEYRNRIGEINRGLGLVNYARGDYPKAIAFYEESLAIFRELNLDRSIILVTTDLGTLYSVVSRYDDAIRMFNQSLEEQKKLSEKRTPFYPGVLGSLAVVNFELGRMDEAEKATQEEIKHNLEFFSEDNFRMGYSYNTLGQIAKHRKQYEAAEGYFNKAFPIFEKSFGLEHIDTLTVLSNLGNLRELLEDYEEAERIAIRVRDIRKKAFGVDHAEYANSKAVLAHLAHLKGDHDEALTLASQGLAIRKQAFGEEHRLVGASFHRIALYLHTLERNQEALTHIDQALEIRQKILDPGSEFLSESRVLRGQIREKLGLAVD